MHLFDLWRRWLNPVVDGRRRRSAPKRNRLSFEGLEDRRLLSAITKVQDFSGSQFQAGVASYALAVPSTIAAGHTVLVEVAIDTTGTVSVSDTVGNTYTKDYDNSNGSTKTRDLVFRSSGVLALPSGDTITVSFPTTAKAKAVAVQEFAGLTSVSPLNVTKQASGTSTAPASGNSATTTQANELLIGAISVQGSTSIAYTAGANFTALTRAGTTDATGPNQTIDPEYRIVSATGAYNATGTLGSSAPWEAELVSYKADLATHFAFSGVPANATAGTSFNVTVTAQTSTNATDTGYVDTVHFTSTDGLAGLPSNYAFTTADAGVHTFSVTLKTAGNQTVTATDTVTGSITGISGSVAVAAPRPRTLSVSATGQCDGRHEPSTSLSRPKTPTVTRPRATPARSTSPAATARPCCRATTHSSRRRRGQNGQRDA